MNTGSSTLFFYYIYLISYENAKKDKLLEKESALNKDVDVTDNKHPSNWHRTLLSLE